MSAGAASTATAAAATSASATTATEAPAADLVFALNGEKVVVKAADVDPSLTLNDFLRAKTAFKGTKLACGEGGCGACAVVLSRIDPAANEPVYLSVNSCLRPLAAMDGWAVTTTEGLGAVDSQKGLHPIQSRMATMNATQCGFCTPGMVCTLYAKLKGAAKAGGATMRELEATYDGNICRCTGYRPILDAAKTFATDTDIEDLVCKSTPKGAAYDAKLHDPAFPEFLRNHKTPERATFACAGNTAAAAGGGIAPGALKWVRAKDLTDVFAQFAAYPNPENDVKLVWANTGSGIYKTDRPQVLVDISGVASLMRLDVTAASVTVGAGYSLTAFLNVCKMLGDDDAEHKTNRAPWAAAMQRHVMRIANTHVRNVGSIGGNLMLAKTRGFQSDLSTLMLGAGATVVWVTAPAAKGGAPVEHTLTYEQFLADGPRRSGVLASVTLPFNGADDAKSGTTTVYRSYKTAIRPENAHALLNAAYRVRLVGQSDAKGTHATFDDVVLAYGGVAYGTPGDVAQRAAATEKLLKGKPVNEDTLQLAVKSLSDEFKISGERADYRQRMVTALFYKFYVSLLAPSGKTAHPVATAAESDTAAHRPLQVGKQDFKFDEKEHAPVSRAIPKVEGGLQCSGEAQFTDDIPNHVGTLFGAPATTTCARGVLTAIDAKAALAYPGVVAFVDASHIGGDNCGSIFKEDQPVFVAVGKPVQYYGQPFGLIVAETKKQAEAAAALVTATYATKADEPPVTTIAHAVAANSFFAATKDFKVGDYAAVKSAHTLTGTVTLGSQQHFYMETQCAYATNDEDGAVVLYASTQWADGVHGAVARCLGLPLHRVKVVHRRAGGAFGGKLSHCTMVATMTAVAARHLKRPVRVFLARATDSAMCGGREESQAEYAVKFDATGRVEGFQMRLIKNSGATTDFSFFSMMAMLGATSQVYHFANYDAAGKLARTNLPPRTVVRGPGEIEASYVVETVLEHVAHHLGVPPHVVRERNFYDLAKLPAEQAVVPNGKPLTHYTLPAMWAKLKADAQFDARAAAVQQYNDANRFRKRGLSITPVRYEVSVWNRSALVNVYGDGSVVVSHSGTEMGQGINTKAAMVAAYGLQKLVVPGGGRIAVPLDVIRFDDLRSDSIPNASFTGGSTGSEATCECVRRACEMLVARIQPVVDKLAKEREEKAKKAAAAATGDAKAGAAAAAPEPALTWAEVAAAAKGAAVNLSAQADWSSATDDSSLTYQNYGCAVSEVELDVLTGEVRVLATDLLYDAGKSLNPAVDIGQCEGAFLMGVSYYLREDVAFDPQSGRLTTDNTWSYKPAMPSDVPRRFHVSLLQDHKFDKGILSSKCSGEPPLVLATSVAMAVRQAVHSARRDAGKTDYPALHVPATLDIIQRACALDADALSLAAQCAKPAKPAATATAAAK